MQQYKQNLLKDLTGNSVHASDTAFCPFFLLDRRLVFSCCESRAMNGPCESRTMMYIPIQIHLLSLWTLPSEGWRLPSSDLSAALQAFSSKKIEGTNVIKESAMLPTHVAMLLYKSCWVWLVFLEYWELHFRRFSICGWAAQEMNARMKHGMKRPTNRCIHAWMCLENEHGAGTECNQSGRRTSITGTRYRETRQNKSKTTHLSSTNQSSRHNPGGWQGSPRSVPKRGFHLTHWRCQSNDIFVKS